MKEPLVSVVIAAYNVENFLVKGIQYIRNQTYQNIEVIIVDDGSTDKTPMLCDLLALQDHRIKVIHKLNGGSGSARNAGINASNGKYIYFFDVDDSLDLNYIKKSVELAETYQTELIIFSYYAHNEGEDTEELISLHTNFIDGNELLKSAFCNELLWMKHGNGFVWNKFYDLSFINKNGIRFGNQRIQQDEAFNLLLYPKLSRVYICSKAYYHYTIYSSGNAGSRFLPNKSDILTDIYHKFTQFYKVWKLDDEKVMTYIRERYVRGIFGVDTSNYFHKDCTYSISETARKIKRDLYRPEMVECTKIYKIQSTNNILNMIQAWAFNNRFPYILILTTYSKIWITYLMKRMG